MGRSSSLRGCRPLGLNRSCDGEEPFEQLLADLDKASASAAATPFKRRERPRSQNPIAGDPLCLSREERTQQQLRERGWLPEGRVGTQFSTWHEAELHNRPVKAKRTLLEQQQSQLHEDLRKKPTWQLGGSAPSGDPTAQCFGAPALPPGFSPHTTARRRELDKLEPLSPHDEGNSNSSRCMTPRPPATPRTTSSSSSTSGRSRRPSSSSSQELEQSLLRNGGGRHYACRFSAPAPPQSAGTGTGRSATPR